MGAERKRQIVALEQDAEKLVVYQTDVIAQIEHQLRAARKTIRLIQKLRAGHLSGDVRDLTNGERHETLDSLSEEWSELDAQLTTQHESCLEIQKTITHMRERLDALRKHRPPAERPRVAPEQAE